MPGAPERPNEEERIKCIDNLGILYTPAEERFDRITRLLKYTFNVPIVLISMVHTDVQWFKSVQGLPVTETSKEVSFCAYAILKQETMVVLDAQQDDRFKDNSLVTGEPHIRFYAGHPLEIDGHRVGTLCIIDRKPREFSSKEFEVLRDFAAMVEKELMAVKLMRREEELRGELELCKRQTLLDPLTHCWNKKGIDIILRREMAKITRQRTQLGLAMLDIDKFKQINDTLGHLAGDQVLSQVAQRLRISLRPYDAIGRYGGDEFLIILPDSDLESVRATGTRILNNMHIDFQLEDQTKVTVSVSIGASSFREGEELKMSKMIEYVDKLLYQAKDNGRDQLVCE